MSARCEKFQFEWPFTDDKTETSLVIEFPSKAIVVHEQTVT